jgi:hypothetical protein
MPRHTHVAAFSLAFSKGADDRRQGQEAGAGGRKSDFPFLISHFSFSIEDFPLSQMPQ